MCEFTSSNNKRKALDFFRHNQFADMNIDGLSERFPYALQEGHCPKCGRYLEDFERRPPGRATRSMCLDDYEYWVAYKTSYECFVCDRPLPDEKIHAQRRDIRELKHRLHDGTCTHIWTIIHNVSVGESDIACHFGKKSKRIVTMELPGQDNPIDNAITTGQLSHPYLDQLFGPTNMPKALPYPVPQLRVPIQKKHNSKLVKAISIKPER